MRWTISAKDVKDMYWEGGDFVVETTDGVVTRYKGAIVTGHKFNPGPGSSMELESCCPQCGGKMPPDDPNGGCGRCR